MLTRNIWDMTIYHTCTMPHGQKAQKIKTIFHRFQMESNVYDSASVLNIHPTWQLKFMLIMCRLYVAFCVCLTWVHHVSESARELVSISQFCSICLLKSINQFLFYLGLPVDKECQENQRPASLVWCLSRWLLSDQWAINVLIPPSSHGSQELAENWAVLSTQQHTQHLTDGSEIVWKKLNRLVLWCC